MSTTTNNETTKMIISFFNMHANLGIRTTEDTLNNATRLIEHFNGDINEVKNAIREWFKTSTPKTSREEKWQGKYFERCVNEIICNVDVKKKNDDVETKTTSARNDNNSISGALGLIEQTLVEVIKKQSIPTIENEIKNECEQMLKDFIAKEYGTIERKIVTIIDGEKKEAKKGEFLHDKFDTVLKFVRNDEPVFLTGPAGSGKNHLCKQIADALGLKFYFTNAVTQEYKLTGFTDANGKYQPTQFYEAFKNGGLFMLDEMDASIPEVLVILNAAIANRYFDFPAPIGFVKAHKDFRIIAAGNTIGQGADNQYVGRNQLDGASLDRFAVVPIDYSVEIENGIACDIELANFCRDIRKSAFRSGIQMIVSYRAIGRLAKMVQLLSLEEALSTCLLKGMEKDDINILCNGLPDSKYKDAMKKMIA